MRLFPWLGSDSRVPLLRDQFIHTKVCLTMVNLKSFGHTLQKMHTDCGVYLLL
jgi:hypothetical protein